MTSRSGGKNNSKRDWTTTVHGKRIMKKIPCEYDEWCEYQEAIGQISGSENSQPRFEKKPGVAVPNRYAFVDKSQYDGTPPEVARQSNQS